MKPNLLNIFRTSKVFAVVLGLHLFVLSLLLFHPGCQRNAPTPAAPADNAPMGQVSAMDNNATLAEPTRPSSTDTNNPVLNDAAAAAETSPSTVVTNEAPPAPVVTETSYTVEKGDSLWSIAKKNGVSVSALLDANGLSRNSMLKPGQTLKVPVAAPAPASSDITDDSSQTLAKEGTYKVKAGDSLAKIAKANHVSVRALKKANHLHSDTVHVGQVLKIPHGKHAKSGVAHSSLVPASKEQPAESQASGTGTTTYTVEKGDTPAVIAKKFGMKTSDLLALNDINDPRKLKVGQELKVKAPAAEAAPASQDNSSDKKPMSVEALEAATATSSDSSAPVVEVKPASTLSK